MPPLDVRLDVLNRVPLLTATVSDDAAARNSADAALSARLDTLEADPTTASALTTAIATEVSDRNTAISTAVNNLVDGAPGLLDTLNEIAAAVGDDSDFVTTVANNSDCFLVTSAPRLLQLLELCVLISTARFLPPTLKLQPSLFG